MGQIEKKRQLRFNIVLVITVILGIRSLAAMIKVIAKYGNTSKEDLFANSMSVAGNYVIFFFLLFACVILSIMARKTAKQWEYITRNICLVGSIIVSMYSSFAVFVVMMLGYAKFLGDQEILKQVYSLEETKILMDNPHEFYAYFLGVIILIPFMIKGFIDIVNYFKTRKKNNDRERTS